MRSKRERNQRKLKVKRKWRLRVLSKRASTLWQGGFFYKSGQYYEGQPTFKFREVKTHGILKSRCDRDGLRWYTKDRILGLNK